MKQAKTGAISGCFVWVIAFCVISMCIFPVSMAAAGMTSISDFAVRFTGGFVCPDGTTAKTRSYATTSTDSSGFPQPSTAYVLQCVDGSGEVVKEDPVTYSFIWLGIFAGAGLLLSGILAFAFAAPAGALMARVINRNRKPDFAENIEPK